MDARLQRRIQRYGWDLAAACYEPLWRAPLAAAQAALLDCAALAPGERVLDVACGTGLVTLPAARAVGPTGQVIAVDIADRMVEALRLHAAAAGLTQVQVARMDAEHLALPDGSVDVVLCALGLMYLPDPAQALREACRVLRPGGRAVFAVWGERARCGWAPLFGIVDAEVSSEVCPLFFGLGRADALARLCRSVGLIVGTELRLATTLDHADGRAACDAAFAGGPVALAWQRFDAQTRERVCARYLEAIAPWQQDSAYRIPAEFVIVAAMAA
ncbi:class I SAM-dependent methyltransferase [Roseateles oligotrophus]|uniref:Methyltransferase domain-containing protein n=1 Tax=Roseateles oligotrophus TaxID=1769250 RepID=A0ABT2YCE3_9BURK|nr:methyltransferase domain-containing protein [Roseateles oligotrophus]MCV2367696.1 methyltransferase domain-containing protein [Roseateles oligotrophus]